MHISGLSTLRNHARPSHTERPLQAVIQSRVILAESQGSLHTTWLWAMFLQWFISQDYQKKKKNNKSCTGLSSCCRTDRGDSPCRSVTLLITVKKVDSWFTHTAQRSFRLSQVVIWHCRETCMLSKLHRTCSHHIGNYIDDAVYILAVIPLWLSIICAANVNAAAESAWEAKWRNFWHSLALNSKTHTCMINICY